MHRSQCDIAITRKRKSLYPRQRTNVILVTMCNNNCFNFVAPSFDKCGIRYNFLDSKLIIAEKQFIDPSVSTPNTFQQKRFHISNQIATPPPKKNKRIKTRIMFGKSIISFPKNKVLNNNISQHFEEKLTPET